jgi:hypothetical protein
MPLTNKQTNDVCNIWANAHQCRYLITSGGYSGNGCHCAKRNFRLKAKIDKEVTQHVLSEKKAGRDPYQAYKPIYNGGSCQGFIMLTTKKQGA